MPSKKKDLYIGTCMDDLHKLSEIKPLGNNPTIIIRSADKVFKDAAMFDRTLDEERSFVMYMKYFNILKQVKSKPDYKKQKQYFDDLIGKKNQITAIERAEALSDILKERYDLRDAEAVAKKLDQLCLKDDNKINTIKEEKKTQTKKEDEKKQQPVPAHHGSITCVDLCELLRDPGAEVILMDVRSSEDFSQSHISHPQCISVPQDVIVPGSTVHRIQPSLPSASKAAWDSRRHVDHVVLFDWNSSIDLVTVGTPLNTLKDALYKFDTTTLLKSEPLVLEGGYAQWLLYYPTMTTNAHVVGPVKGEFKAPSPTHTLDFDYPELDENLQKVVPPDMTSHDTADSPGQVDLVPVAVNNHPAFQMLTSDMPRFDRTLKPGSTGTPVNVSTPVSSLLNTDNSSISGGLYPNVIYEKQSDISSTYNKNINVQTDFPKDVSKPTNLDIELKESMVERDKKEAELREFQERRDRLLDEDNARVAEAERKLRALEEMRRKEQKDVADLMRMKKKLTEEMDGERRRQEEDNKRLAKEESWRVQALSLAKQKEEDQKGRMSEVEKMRDERKINEHQKEKERLRGEDDYKKLVAAAAETRLHTETLEREKEMERDKEIDRDKVMEREKEIERDKVMEREKQAESDRQKLILENEAKQLERLKLEKAESARQEKLRKEKEAGDLVKVQKERENAERIRKEEDVAKREAEEYERQEKKQREQEVLRLKEKERQRLEEEERKKKEQMRIKELDPQSTPQSKSVTSSFLPAGWEKRKDFATNRYFYIDHNTGTTHWYPPHNPAGANKNGSGSVMTKLKEEPSISSSRGLSRSHSSPDIKKDLEEEERKEVKVLPGVNRGAKPSTSKASPMRQISQPRKQPDLNPVYGNVGQALTGLRNLGNTCYMNSTIQCLNNATPLVAYILNDLHLRDINRETSTGMHGEVVEDFAAVVKALWSQQYRSISPKDLKTTVGKYNPMFAGYQQQDSQEFLTFLLDGLHEGLNEVRQNPKIPEQDNDNVTDIIAADTAWKHHRMLHRSVIVELFQGQLKSTLQCRTCHKQSVNFQAFMFLSLPIPASNKCSLKDCLRAFLKPEMMTGSSRWKCPRCKVERDSEKKIDIWKLPHILLIGLNRFYSEGMWMQKKTTYVDFPTQGLDLSDNVIGPKPKKAFNLYGISNHYGTMEGGHYTAFCRNPVSKNWNKFDDQDVYEISSSDVKTSAAFVLYYSSIDLQEPKRNRLTS